MKIHISNQLESLVQHLADSINTIQTKDWSASITILIPNFNLEKWISLRLAELTPIAVNLNFMQIEKFLKQQASEPKRPLWNFETLQLALMIEMDQILASSQITAELTPLKTYLESVIDIPDMKGLKENRVAMLAHHVAKIFQHYSIFRDIDILQKWESQKSFLPPSANSSDREVEQWQRELWKALSQQGISLKRHLTHTTYQQPESFIYVFGFSYLPPFQYEALQQLVKTGCNLTFYAQTPCQEFWEDARTGQKILNHAINPEPTEQDQVLNSFLQCWGRPTKEHLKSLMEQSNYTFHDHFQETPKHTLLAHIQNQILYLQETPYPHSIKEDDSLHFWGASNIRHEAEAVVGTICDRLSKDDTLRLDQIAIITPNLSTYQKTLEETFTKIGQGKLTYNLIDAESEHSFQLVRAVLLLFQLGTRQLSRKNVWTLISHQNFLTRFQISETTLKQWENWIIQSGIFYDVPDGSLAPFSWEQGFLRLELGACFATPSANQDFVIAGKNYPPLPIIESNVTDLLQMITTLRDLFKQLEILKHKKTITEWGEFFSKLVEKFLAPCQDHEKIPYEKILIKLRDFSSLEDIGAERQLSGFYTIKLAEIRLKEMTANKGFYLSGGVSISSFLPMRPIPFRIIFIMGLNEGVFPREQNIDQMNLTRLLPLQRCDFTIREKDSYAFLETFLAAKDALYTSYVCKNSNGEDALPSILLQIMIRIINEHYLKHSQESISLQTLGYFTSQELPEFAKYNAQWVQFTNLWNARQTLKKILQDKQENIEQVSLHDLRQWSKAKGLLPDTADKANTPPPDKPQRQNQIVPIYNLKTFFENPAWGAFKFHTRQIGNDELYHEMPEWDIDVNFKYSAIFDLWNTAITTQNDDWKTHTKAYQTYLKDRSLWNDHILGIVSFRFLEEKLAHWKSVIEGTATKKGGNAIFSDWQDFAKSVEFYLIGKKPSGFTSGNKYKILPPLIIPNVQVCQHQIDVEIVGDIGWLSEDAIFAFQNRTTTIFDLMTTCLLPITLLAACDHLPNLKTAYLIGKEKTPRLANLNTQHFHELTDDARNFLRHLLESLLNPTEQEYLPLSSLPVYRQKTLQAWHQKFNSQDKDTHPQTFHQEIETKIANPSFSYPDGDHSIELAKNAVHQFRHTPDDIYESIRKKFDFFMNKLLSNPESS